MSPFIDKVVALVRTAPAATTLQDLVVQKRRPEPEDEPSALNLAMRTAPLDELLEVATGWARRRRQAIRRARRRRLGRHDHPDDVPPVPLADDEHRLLHTLIRHPSWHTMPNDPRWARVIGALLDGGVRSDQVSRLGNPLLLETVRFANMPMAHRLLDALPGLDVNQAASDGAIALHLAVRKGDRTLVQRLILAGSSLEARSRNGHTPLLGLVATYSNTPMTALLLDAGADVHAQDENGRNGLHFTVRLGHADLTDVLLNHGADPTRTDPHGRTPLAYAQERLGWLRTEGLAREDKAVEAQQLQAALDRYQDRVVREERESLVAVLNRDQRRGENVRSTTDESSPGMERNRRRL